MGVDGDQGSSEIEAVPTAGIDAGLPIRAHDSGG